MAQALQNLVISNPGFEGVNTEDSPLLQDPGFCRVADNAIIDQFGRIGSREAFKTFTGNASITVSNHADRASSTTTVHRIGSGFIGGTLNILCVVSHKQFNTAGAQVQINYFLCKESSGSLTEVSYPSLNDASQLLDAQIVSFVDRLYIFSKTNAMLVFNGSTIVKVFTGSQNTDYIPPQTNSGVISSEINGNVVCSAYGRLWVAGVGNDYNVIYFSDLQKAHQWYDGKSSPSDATNTAGFIDIEEFWPTGSDSIVGIEAHNNFLIVFGRTSILVFGNPSGDPAAANGIFLSDTVSNIGLVSRDATANTGSDLLFVDDSGVRSFGRTIQEKSAPIGDLTRNVRTEISDLIRTNSDKTTISLTYLQNKNLAVCIFSNDSLAFVIDLRSPSKSGANKITRWKEVVFERAEYVEAGNEAFTVLGSNNSNGLLKYDGFLEYDSKPYTLQYESNQFSFGDATRTKFIKKLIYTVISANAESTAVARWGYEGEIDLSSNFNLQSIIPAKFGEAEFGVGEFGSGSTLTVRYKTNAKGSGNTVRVGINASIVGNVFSLQEIDIQTLLGRIT